MKAFITKTIALGFLTLGAATVTQASTQARIPNMTAQMSLDGGSTPQVLQNFTPCLHCAEK